MTRFTVAVDRVMTFVVGALLLAGGVVAILWIFDALLRLPRVLSAAPAAAASRESWWPWALLGAGVVLILVGLRWLIAHHPPRRIADFTLDYAYGGFTVDLGSLADAAADIVASQPAVRSAKGIAIVERGRPTIVLRVTVDATSRLDEVVAAVDETARTGSAMLGAGSVAFLTRIRLARHGSRGVR